MIMSDPGFPMSLSPSERRLINTLRDLPESRLKTRVHHLVDELVTFIQFPRCQFMQGDGVPCGTVDRDCDQCVHLNEMLERLSDSMLEK